MQVDPVSSARIEGWLRELADVIDRINCGLIGRDAEGRILFVNERVLKWGFWDRDELIGTHVEELFPPELREAMRAEVRAAEHGDLRARLSAMQRRDGTTFPVLIIPQTFEDRDGRHAGIVSLLVDLGTIETAKHVGGAAIGTLTGRLARIAQELRTISLSAALSPETGPIARSVMDALSPREAEVLQLLVAGLRSPAIAQRLHISPHTVRNHLKSLFRKLEVGSQSELIERVRAMRDPAIFEGEDPRA